MATSPSDPVHAEASDPAAGDPPAEVIAIAVAIALTWPTAGARPARPEASSEWRWSGRRWSDRPRYRWS